MTTVLLKLPSSQRMTFSTDSFERVVGKMVPLVGFGMSVDVRLEKAEVREDGRVALLTLDCDEMTTDLLCRIGGDTARFDFDPKRGIVAHPIPAVPGSLPLGGDSQ